VVEQMNRVPDVQVHVHYQVGGTAHIAHDTTNANGEVDFTFSNTFNACTIVVTKGSKMVSMTISHSSPSVVFDVIKIALP
ncbi:MAG: hypothetical protein MUC47_09500, partial [Candidatus Kapabacteria bacterium]|nr:hypothetical protein [Candidatus Kapabacteria bacterium]